MINLRKTRTIMPLAIILSLAAHLWASAMLGGWGKLAFARAPFSEQFIIASLVDPAGTPAVAAPVATAAEPPTAATANSTLTAESPNLPIRPVPVGAPVSPDRSVPVACSDITGVAPSVAAPIVENQLPLRRNNQTLLPAPLRTVDQFIRTKREVLTYQLFLMGIPAGTTELDASNNNGELLITSRTESNGAFSLFYPIDTTTRTRMFSGRYIMTTIQQRQGDQISDTGFTISLGEKYAFWADRINKRYSNVPLPNNEVLDIFTALYFLRNQQMKAGDTFLLHIFDSSRYASTPVKVLRQEKIRLADLRMVDTLVIKPDLTTEGFFRRTGEILIWVTDDENHVPVRLETEIALGRVSAELVRSESGHQELPVN